MSSLWRGSRVLKLYPNKHQICYKVTYLTNGETFIMTMRDSDWHSESDLDSIRNFCDVFFGNWILHLIPIKNIIFKSSYISLSYSISPEYLFSLLFVTRMILRTREIPCICIFSVPIVSQVKIKMWSTFFGSIYMLYLRLHEIVRIFEATIRH